jgi:hypothetical protein
MRDVSIALSKAATKKGGKLSLPAFRFSHVEFVQPAAAYGRSRKWISACETQASSSL